MTRERLMGRSPTLLRTKGHVVISEALAPAPAMIGFRGSCTIDDSPELQEKVRLAVARAKEGDQEALRYLYVTYSQNIYGYVRSIVRDDYGAEDVTQHVFAKLMTAIVKYDERGIPFFSWLLRLARNVAIDHLRANRPIPSECVLDPESSASNDADRSQTVRAALSVLPSEQREVVILRHVVGLTPGEIAVRMGRTEGSIHGLHHRGRRALQRELSRVGLSPCTRTKRGLAAA